MTVYLLCVCGGGGGGDSVFVAWQCIYCLKQGGGGECICYMTVFYCLKGRGEIVYLNPNNTNARLMASALSLALDPTFGIHFHETLDTAQPCHLLKPN